MPHLSKRKFDESVKKNIESRLFQLIAEEGGLKRNRIIKEILTPTEHLMILKRLALLVLISKNYSIYYISKVTGMSFSTVNRFRLSVEKGYYRNSLSWIKKMHLESKLLRFIFKIVSIPFEARRKSFYKSMKDVI